MKFILTSLLLASLCASAQTQGPTVSASPTQPSPTPNSSFLTPNSPDAPSTNRPPIVVEPGRAGARAAQSLLRKGKPGEAAEAFLSAARGADLEEAETYRYNAAFAYCQAKNVDKAVETLRPLLTSRKNGAKAGELIGKLLMQKAKEKGAEDPAAKADALEEAAAGFQRSLRDTPKDERRNRNLTRAVSPLAEARETAHIAKVMKEHGQTPPDQLMGAMLAEQRAILDESSSVFTNDAPALIGKAEALAKRQEKQADLWIPLKQHILQAVTNQQQQALFSQQIELARDSMKGATAALQDLMPEAANDTAQAEPLVYAFWKAVTMPPAALDEDILCQSNALQKLTGGYRYLETRDTQHEALQLTQLFRERFPEWAQQYQQQAKTDTNMPPFTAEDQAKINEIAAHAEKLQTEIIDKKPQGQERRALQEQTLKDLLEIRDLLPKQKSQNQQQQNQQQQNPQPQQQQNQQQQPQEQKQEEQKNEEQKQEKKQEPPQDVQEVLRRALDREKEHENEKKEKMRKLPMSPSERDW